VRTDFRFDILTVQQYNSPDIFKCSFNIMFCLIVDWNLRIWCWGRYLVVRWRR